MILLNPCKSTYLFLFLLMYFQLFSCQSIQEDKTILTNTREHPKRVISGAENTEAYISLLKGKRIGIVANQTSVIYKKTGTTYLQESQTKKDPLKKLVYKNTHLIDSLLSLNINIQKVFAPEHGFRGEADAAELVKDGIDAKTGIPIISLYGKNKKPTPKQLRDLEIIVFDIQDVGVRFYTYISTLHYVMEACAEANIPILILDRPNPNAHYIDGPVLEEAHTSFVGKHTVPVVYGMTIGEYGQMINGEKWLKNGIQSKLTVIPLQNYTHNSDYHIPIRPSPNLPNDKAINYYPSLGFFEGTTINAGRGTAFQFQRYGAPFFPKTDFKYTPKSNFGAKYPKHQNKVCYGINLNETEKLSTIQIDWLIDAYQKTPKNQKFFGSTFTIHAGTTKLQEQLEKGISAKAIRKSWQNGINNFKKIRKRYLIYK